MERGEESYGRSRYESERGAKQRSPSRSRSRSESRHRSKKYSRSRSRSYKRYRSRSRSYDDYRGNRRQGYRGQSPRRRHMGDRENPKTSKCLGVFGLSIYTREDDLRPYFEKYGPVDELQIVYDHHTGKSRGFAFVYMHDINDAIEAKERMPGLEIDGKPIRVDFSVTARAHTPTPGVYMGKTTSRSGGYGRDSRRMNYRSRDYSRSRSRSGSYRRRHY